jgi:hypothetical protein
MASTLNYANTLSPKTARSVLVPPDATDVPAPIVEANKAAVEKVEALERANQALRDAMRVAADAPRRDKAARVGAHQADKAPPAPTVAKANEAVELAEGTRDLCRRDATGRFATCTTSSQPTTGNGSTPRSPSRTTSWRGCPT